MAGIMAATDATANDSTPLIRSCRTKTASSKSSKQKRRILLLLYAFTFTMMLGDNLQPAALMQIFESVICDDYYKAMPSLATSDRCQAQPVQRELAFVHGMQQLVTLVPALLCTVPYSILAERIGRKRVLVLSGAGVFAALSWVMAVCYWRFGSIRWVLLSAVFLLIGGGDAVTSSLVHVMVTDITSQAERAQIFLNLHAADVLSGFLGPAISAPLMEKGHAWSVLLLAQVVLFSGAFLITRNIPETGPARHASDTNAMPSAVITTVSPPSRFAKLVSNRQALLILLLFAPQTSARELFTVIGLQYSRAKFTLSYARGNVLLSFFQGAQGLFVLVLLPIVTRTLAEQRGWTGWARDRRFTIFSIAVMASGLAVIGFAPFLFLAAAGLLLVAIGSCTTGLLMSLLGSSVPPSEVSTFYSAALTLSIVMRSTTGPFFSMLLVKGLGLGPMWMGLPFVVMAVLMAGLTVASCFIREDKTIDGGDD